MVRTANAFSRLAVLLVLALPMLSMLIAQVLFTPSYLMNDDIGMSMLASGVGFGSSPTPCLLYSSPILGGVLSTLYRHLPCLPWYHLVATGVHLLSGIVLVAISKPWEAWTRRLGPLLIFFFTVDVIFHACPQFTVTAILPALAAVGLWLTRDEERCWSLPVGLLFFGLVFLSVLVRSQSTQLVLVLALPIVLLDLLWRGGITRWKQFLLPFSGFVLVIAAVSSHDEWYHRHREGWSAFRDYNRLRAEFTDYHRLPFSPQTRAVYDSVGWSENDYRMMRNWFFADPEVFGADRLRSILAAAPRQGVSLERLPAHWRYLRADRLVPLLFLAVLGIGLFLPVEAGTWMRWLGTMAGIGAVWVALVCWQQRCTPALVQALLGSASLFGILLVVRGTPSPLSGFKAIPALVGMVAILVFGKDGYVALHERSVHAERARANLYQQLERRTPTPDELYVAWGGDFPYDCLLPTDDLRPLRTMKLYPLGALTPTPIATNRLLEFGILDLVSAVYERPEVRVICSPDKAAMLVTYVREHRGVEVEARPVLPGGPAFTMFQFVRASPAGPGSSRPRSTVQGGQE